MGEYATCPSCQNYINLEIDVIRDDDGIVCCIYCGEPREEQS